MKTRVGFSDGAEAVQVDFDPKIVTYDALLDMFWASHRPTSNNDSRLYKNAIFYHSAQQKAAALASKKRAQSKNQLPITSTLEPARFSVAGESEQKYYLRHDSVLWQEFLRHYPNSSDIVNSAAAAKANGYLGGNSDKTQFKAYVNKLGLSPGGAARLERKVPQKAQHFLPKCSLPE